MSDPIHLFEAVGVELEYMIVHRDDLRVYPLTDEVIRAVTGVYGSDVERGAITWSNELVLHVIEFKTTEPAASLAGLADAFQANVREVNRILEPMAACLLPTASHPTMNPDRDTRLWPHEYSPVYDAFNRVFDCRGHGWSNLQSIHINLPFAGDDEFGRLHAAIRLVLPILPAIAASSPIVNGRATPFHDFRLEAYRTNAARVPSVNGHVIPEPAFSRSEYEEGILHKMFRDIAPLDPDGTLQLEWLNNRGAIARFVRDTIEIRVLDVQECPAADLAIVASVVEVVRALVEERWETYCDQRAWPTERLADIFLDCVRTSDRTVISDMGFLHALGWSGGPCAARDLWRHLYDTVMPGASAAAREAALPLEFILEHGTLARRILNAVERTAIEATYTRLAECLRDGRLFDGHA